MSIKNFFTSYFDSFSDKKTRYHFKNELKNRLIENQYFNFYEGKETFSAVVLQIDAERPTEGSVKTIDNFLIAKVRPIDIHDFIIPEPCEQDIMSTWDDYDRLSAMQERVDLHPTAYSDFRGLDKMIQVGQIVECYYELQGPEFHGRQRGLRFSNNFVYGQASTYNFKCLEKYSGDYQGSRASEIDNLGTDRRQPIDLEKHGRDDPIWSKKGKASTWRDFPYDRLKFKQEEGCPPQNPNSSKVTKYFTNDQWQAFTKKLSSFEGNYKSVNPWGYLGKYQLSLGSLKSAKLISGDLKTKALEAAGRANNGKKKQACSKCKTFSTAVAGAGSKSLNKVGKAIISVLTNNSWTGTYGVNSITDFFKNKGNCQDKGLIPVTNKRFSYLRGQGLIESDNICDTAGKLAYSHLVGEGNIKNFTEGRERSDGWGTFGAKYYIALGNTLKKECLK